MNAVLGENILQLANRLSQQQKQRLFNVESEAIEKPVVDDNILQAALLSVIRDTDASGEQKAPVISSAASYSPWVRNAGRKKSHPVWHFFKDMKGADGTGGVVCLHCGWTGDDRSPNNLRTHLKKMHTADGIFLKFSEKLAVTPTQPYVKRARAGGSNLSPLPGDLREEATSFLDSIPRINEVINITAGFAVDDEESKETNPGCSSASSDIRHSSSPSADSPPATAPSPTGPVPAFSLNDGHCVSVLMKMALDLDLTLSYHKRRGEIELCFESNRTAEKSGGRGKVIALTDVGREIRIIEKVNGNMTETELWTKTDVNQFHWAIRGKCMKVLGRQ